MPRHTPPGAGSNVRILLFLIMIVFIIMIKIQANKAAREQLEKKERDTLEREAAIQAIRNSFTPAAPEPTPAPTEPTPSPALAPPPEPAQ